MRGKFQFFIACLHHPLEGRVRNSRRGAIRRCCPEVSKKKKPEKLKCPLTFVFSSCCVFMSRVRRSILFLWFFSSGRITLSFAFTIYIHLNSFAVHSTCLRALVLLCVTPNEFAVAVAVWHYAILIIKCIFTLTFFITRTSLLSAVRFLHFNSRLTVFLVSETEFRLRLLFR